MILLRALGGKGLGSVARWFGEPCVVEVRVGR
jgi:hypothetical protein